MLKKGENSKKHKKSFFLLENHYILCISVYFKIIRKSQKTSPMHTPHIWFHLISIISQKFIYMSKVLRPMHLARTIDFLCYCKVQRFQSLIDYMYKGIKVNCKTTQSWGGWTLQHRYRMFTSNSRVTTKS